MKTGPLGFLQMLAGMVAWLLGVGAQLQQATLWSMGLYGGMLLGASMLGGWALSRAGRKGGKTALILGLLAVGGAGFAWTGCRAQMRCQDALMPGLMGRDVVLTGVVAELPDRSVGGVRFRFEVEEAFLQQEALPSVNDNDAQADVDTHADAEDIDVDAALPLPRSSPLTRQPASKPMQRVQVPQQVLLSWFSGSSFQATASVADIATPDVRPGQRWRLTARLQPPFALMNPGAFDHELWMFEQNLRAQGTVVRQSPLLLTQTLWHPFEQWRWHVRRAIDQQINDAQAAGVLSGLAFGDQGAIQSEDWDVFRKTGVAHLLAVSGLHITLFSWVASAAMRRTWRWWPVHWQVAIDRTTAGRWGGVALAFGYALFTGWGLPAQRTVLMLSWVACLRQRAWQWPWPMILAGSAVVVTVVDPWALLQAGFWLSFAAVGLLMLGGDSAAKGWRAACWQSLETQARATVGLAPLSVVFFHQVPLLGLAANLVAIPWVTFVITPLALGGMVLPSLWSMGTWTVKALMAFLTPLANSASAVWQVQAASSGWVLLLGLSAAVLGLAPLPWSLRCLAVPLALPMFFPGAVRPESGAFEVIAADVGQGTAVLIRTASHTLLFDSGPRYSAHSDAGGRVIAPLLHLLGEERLDTLVLSHSDLDHIGGAKAVAQALPVTRLLSSLKPTHELHRLFKVSEPCLAGQRWTWDGVTFEVLHPTPRDLQRHRAGHTKPNTVSCVVRVQNSAQHSVLLTGDIEAAQEWDLVNSLGSRLQTEVLIVPHHGSKTSSTPAFLDAVQPRWAVFQAGWRNRYGHPAPLVMQRYVDRSIGVVTSPTCGAWRWMASAQTASAGFKPQDYVCERSLQDRYWRTKIGGMF